MMKHVKIVLLGILVINFFFLSCSGDEEPITKEESLIQKAEEEKATLSFHLVLNDLVNAKTSTRQEAADIPACAEDIPY